MEAIHLCTGRAGCVWPQVLRGIGAQEKAGDRVLLLVPEMNTLQAERDLIEGLNLPGFFELEVLSPRRLRRRVQELAGGSALPPLDPRGAAMAMGEVLAANEGKLLYYGKVASKTNLPARIMQELRAMQDAGLEPEQLLEQLDELDSAAHRAKLHDLLLCWQLYRAQIAGRFLDTDEQDAELLARLPASGLMDGAHLWVYGFDTFSQRMIALLEAASHHLKSLHVTLVCDDEDAPDGRIFSTQQQCLQQLADALKGQPVGYAHWTDAPEGRQPALAHLERHLFSARPKVFDAEPIGLHVRMFPQPYDEAMACAETLLDRHRAGVPWREMIVATAGTPSVHLAQALKRCGVPFFLGTKAPAARHPLCRMLLSALRAVGAWDSADVLDAARTGFTALSVEEAARLETYALAHGIRRAAWKKPFTRGAEAETVEPLRVRLMTPLLALHDGLVAARDADASLAAVMQLLDTCGAFAKLQGAEQQLLERGMLPEAGANRQVWRLMLSLMEQLHALLAGKRATLAGMARLMATGIETAELSELPSQADAVLVGGIGSYTAVSADTVLVLGLQDGVLGASESGLLTDDERLALRRLCKRPIGQTGGERSRLRQCDFYRTFAMARQELILCWNATTELGQAQRGATLLGDVQRLFPKLHPEGSIRGGMRVASSFEPVMETAAVLLRDLRDGLLPELPPAWKQALAGIAHGADHDRLRELFVLAGRDMPLHRISVDAATALFLADRVSISRLEAFAACPYRHFVRYGLRPQEEELFTFEAADAGDFYHAVLDHYLRMAVQEPDWPNLKEDEIDRLADQAISPLITEWEDSPLGEDALGRQLAKHYRRVVRRTVREITHHAVQSGFRPVGTEVCFGFDSGDQPLMLVDGQGRRTALHGVIDRVDRWQDYVRVVDYKSGNKELVPDQIAKGLQLQLPLYLRVAAEKERATPSGMLYMRIQDPWVDTLDDPAAAAEAITQEMGYHGAVLADEAVTRAMALSDGKQTKVISYSAEELEQLLQLAEKTAGDMSGAIRAGDIHPQSLAFDSSRTSCSYCAYQTICGYDSRLDGFQAQSIKGAAKAALGGETGKNGDSETIQEKNKRMDCQTDKNPL